MWHTDFKKVKNPCCACISRSFVTICTSTLTISSGDPLFFSEPTAKKHWARRGISSVIHTSRGTGHHWRTTFAPLDPHMPLKTPSPVHCRRLAEAFQGSLLPISSFFFFLFPFWNCRCAHARCHKNAWNPGPSVDSTVSPGVHTYRSHCSLLLARSLMHRWYLQWEMLRGEFGLVHSGPEKVWKPI